MDELKLITVLIQAGLQSFCILIAIAAYLNRHNNGGRPFWWWFAAGFTFQLVRRVMYFLVLVGYPDLKFFTFIVVPTCVSVCYTVAMVKVIRYVRERSRALSESQMQVRELARKLGVEV